MENLRLTLNNVLVKLLWEEIKVHFCLILYEKQSDNFKTWQETDTSEYNFKSSPSLYKNCVDMEQ